MPWYKIVLKSFSECTHRVCACNLGRNMVVGYLSLAIQPCYASMCTRDRALAPKICPLLHLVISVVCALPMLFTLVLSMFVQASQAPITCEEDPIAALKRWWLSRYNSDVTVNCILLSALKQQCRHCCFQQCCNLFNSAANCIAAILVPCCQHLKAALFNWTTVCRTRRCLWCQMVGHATRKIYSQTLRTQHW